MDPNQLTALLAVISIAAFLGLLLWHIFQSRAVQRMLNEGEKTDWQPEEILRGLPLALAVIDQQGMILWHNSACGKIFAQENMVSRGIGQYLPKLKWDQTSLITIQRRRFRVESRHLHAPGGAPRILLTLIDTTVSVDLEHQLVEEQPAVALIQLDNLSEAFQGVDDAQRGLLLAEIDKILNDWAMKTDSYLKKFAEDRRLLLISQTGVRETEKSRFDVLDRVREISLGNTIPLTLSIGVGMGDESMADLGRLANAGLELALSRGGDQVVLKWTDRVLFYGGKSNAVAKKTKVRARVVANTLRQQIQQADQVLIMGHANSDLDSAGSSLGIATLARYLGKPVFVALDNATGTLDNLFNLLPEYPSLNGLIITGKEALGRVSDNTLLVVVDTNKPSLLIAPAILDKVKQTILIDHHRRAEEYIKQAQLAYLEPYASSTSELVTEIIQYLGEEMLPDPLFASVLLAGIVVDTRNFSFQTGVRTFEAAAYLKQIGAEPVLVRRLLQDDLDTVLQRAQVLKQTKILFGQVAVAALEEEMPHGTMIAAQTADVLLTIDQVKASFVLYPVADGINISARSNGEVNVQVLTEKLGGGGHFTVAGAQLKGSGMAEAMEKLESLLAENFAEKI